MLFRHRIFYNGCHIIVSSKDKLVDNYSFYMYDGQTGNILASHMHKNLREVIQMYMDHNGYAGMDLQEFINKTLR